MHRFRDGAWELSGKALQWVIDDAAPICPSTCLDIQDPKEETVQ